MTQSRTRTFRPPPCTDPVSCSCLSLELPRPREFLLREKRRFYLLDTFGTAPFGLCAARK